MNIFYTPQIEENSFTLSEEESKHCIRVLRRNLGDMLTLTDGKGYWYEAEIVDANPKRCRVEVRSKRAEERPNRQKVHMAVAPTKNNDRLEWFLEKATEIGLDEFTPLLCEHSERKQINAERFEKVVVSAMKQSLKATLPQLNKLTTFDDFIEEHQASNGLIAYCGDVEKVHLAQAIQTNQPMLILIGPEGDFSENEVKRALEFGFKTISLGESRLRTETAALVACTIANVYPAFNKF